MQMKWSRDTLDTKTMMEMPARQPTGRYNTSKYWKDPNSTYKANRLALTGDKEPNTIFKLGFDDYYLADHLINSDGSLNTTSASHQPFQYFYRLSGGNESGLAYAVDVEFPQNTSSMGRWRMLTTDEPDTRNQWLAKDKIRPTGRDVSYWSEMPDFKSAKYELVKSGTFYRDANEWPHAVIPELDMTIANFW